jgi:aryl-alcohol dehydrogenase-like predicted oxidoreductase
LIVLLTLKGGLCLKTRTLGKNGPQLSQVGLGCMGMSDFYGSKETRDDKESVATINLAVEEGINFFDTGDYYGMGHNELLLREAMKGRRNKFFLSVKFGALRGLNGEFTGTDLRPVAVKNFISYSLQRLDTDYIDLYQPGRLDPQFPIEDTVDAIADLIKEGKVRYLGLSEATSEQIRRAHEIHPVSAVQIEYSLASRVVESKILPTTRELGISLVAYGALSRGLLSGQSTNTNLQPGDFRNFLPRFSSENREQNSQIVNELKKFAESKGVTAAQLAIAWVLHQGEDIITLVGTSKRSRLLENLKSQNIQLNNEDQAYLDRTFHEGAIAGDRYPEFVTDIVR